MISVFEIEQIRSACSGKWMQKPESPKPPHITGVGIDSRDDLTGKAFIAIRGEAHDGHDHLAQAVENGSRLLIVQRDRAESVKLPPNVHVMHVESTRKALGKIAHAYRQSLRGTKVIAVTGSAGKTTTKRLIHGALSATLQGSASAKSFNNDIGVPLTLLAAKSSDKYVIVEIGTNAPGEIADLAEIAQPDIAVVTMIGRSHLEGLGSIEGVALEKGSMLRSLSSDEGVAIVNADYALLRPHFKRIKTRFLFGESADADLRLTNRGASEGGGCWFLEMNGRTRFDIALPGRHNALNALAAIAVARRMGLNDDDIRRGLLAVKPEAMRMTPQAIAGVTFYNDAYNANPDSMIASLDTFAELAAAAPRRIVILGDMLEIGASSCDLHAEIGRHLARINDRVGVDHALLIGSEMKHAAKAATQSLPPRCLSAFASLNAEAISAARAIIRPGDAVLVKASRGMGLEKVIDALESSPEISGAKAAPKRRKRAPTASPRRKKRQPA
jgi:UDP-N-acetylmuramoyl-tripeptide--D-alanyl-D-alanine ligase